MLSQKNICKAKIHKNEIVVVYVACEHQNVQPFQIDVQWMFIFCVLVLQQIKIKLLQQNNSICPVFSPQFCHVNVISSIAMYNITTYSKFVCCKKADVCCVIMFEPFGK